MPFEYRTNGHRLISLCTGLVFKWSVQYIGQSLRPTICIPNHLKSKLQKVWYSNVSGIQMVCIQIPTVIVKAKFCVQVNLKGKSIFFSYHILNYPCLPTIDSWYGTVAQWICHLLMVPRDPGSHPGGGKNLLLDGQKRGDPLRIVHIKKKKKA